jgi:SH3-like domain-containing protein
VKGKLFLIMALIFAAPALAEVKKTADNGTVINVQNGVTVKAGPPEKSVSAQKEYSGETIDIKASGAEDEDEVDEDAPIEPEAKPVKTLKMKPILGSAAPAAPAPTRAPKPAPFKKSQDANIGETIKKPAPKPRVESKPLTGAEDSDSISDELKNLDQVKTGKATNAEDGFGESGLPIPRFVSLKSGEVNARTGPGDSYPIRWVYQRKNLPVEVTAEFKLWRRIRDFDGEQSWVHQALLSNRRYAAIKSDATVNSEYNDEGISVARMKRGVQVELLECKADYCRVEYGHIEGWLKKKYLWGVYPAEVFN